MSETGRRAGYAIGVVGPMLGWVAANQYLLYFYTEVLRLPASTAGLVFGIGMAWDALSDPVIGWLADRTRSRWGRYRAWLLWAAVPYGLSIPLAFAGAGGTGGIAAVAAVLATNVVFRTLYSAIYMPYTAMLAGMAPSYDERTGYTSWKTAFVFSTNLLVSLGFLTVVLAFGGESVRGFAVAGGMIGAVAIATTLACYRATGAAERGFAGAPGAASSVARGIADLGSDRAFLVLFGGVLLSGGFGAVQVAATAYVAKYWLGDPGAARWLFAWQAVAALASIPLWAAACRRLGKHRIWIAGAALSAASLVAAWLARPATALGLIPFYGLAQVGYTAFIIVMFAMTADVADWGEARRGRRHEGVAFGAIAFANKLAAGLATAAAGALLGAIGIGATARAVPDAAARSGLLAVALLLPAAGYALAALLLLAYPVTREAHGKALEAMRARAR